MSIIKIFIHLTIQFRLIFHSISFIKKLILLIVHHFLSFFINHINLCFFHLNYLFIIDFHKFFIHLNHSNFINRQIIFYIFLFLPFLFEFNQSIILFEPSFQQQQFPFPSEFNQSIILFDPSSHLH